jgi:hypothetical protein
MTIKYSPSYQGFTYLNLKDQDNNLALDVAVNNTAGLLDCLELYAGKHVECLNSKQRIAHYYSAIYDYTEKHPQHKLAKSFRLDGLGTAKTCLFWRDLLVEAGWNGQASTASGRMEVLCEVEKSFNCPGTGERIHALISHINEGCSLPPDLTIELGCPEDCLPPSIKALFDALRERKVEIRTPQSETGNGSNLSLVRQLVCGQNQNTLTLQQNDDSFQIYKFKQRQDALNWLTLQPAESYNVWIDSDNKDFDNTLRLSGQPVCGSTMKDVLPQVSQLLVIGLNLFPQPLNIQFLLEWLHAPVSPLEGILRRPLADAIIDSGGYYNQKCRDVIDNYLKGEYDIWEEGITEEEKQEVIKSKKRKRCNAIRRFLPPMNKPTDILSLNDNVNKESVYKFVRFILSWSKNRMFQNIDESVKRQLGTIKEQADALLLLLEKQTQDEIPFAIVQGWINSLYEKQDCPLYDAEQNCRCIIASPALLADKADSTIWCDFYGGAMLPASYSFLSQKEIDVLTNEKVKLWNAADERRYNAYLQQIPFVMTSGHLSLVVVERDGSTVLPKHPLMILLEQSISNLDLVIEEPLIAEKKYNERSNVDNSLHDANYLEINNTDQLRRRDQESATSLESLIQYPFDYSLQYLMGIRDDGVSTMMRLDRTQGEVAHAVIATLFHKEGETNDPDTILQRVTADYDTTFSNALLEKGAILLLRENRVDIKIMKDRLRNAIDTLLDIMRSNKLHVVDCEKEILRRLQFEGDPDIKGFVDMILGDNNDNLYVFDFKWTSSKSKYDNLLKKNSSLQLALYKEMVEQELGKKVIATAYYLMPENCLYSISNFNGENTKKLEEVENVGQDLFLQVKNSYKYRLQQIMGGEIELAEGKPTTDLQYDKDVDQEGLMPLRKRDGMKETNIFSNYKCFKK